MSYSQTTIMTVGELIDSAFGEPDTNIVHHKHIQAILFLLARQLRVLQRRVNINLGSESEPFNSTLSVTEVKLHALNTKKKKSQRSADSGKSVQEEKYDSKKSSGKSTPQTQKLEASNKTSPSKKSHKTSSSAKGPEEYAAIIDEFEMQRERELRLIHQRADSMEEHDKQPTPMESLDSIEAKYEKLLIVERVPIGEARARAARERSGAQSTRSDTSLAIVTQEEFLALVRTVRELQQKFGVEGDLPERLKLMLELRKGASLTDAMSALQLSARLEATEKMIDHLVSLVTELAVRSGIDVHSDKDMQVIFKGTAEKSSAQDTKSVSLKEKTMATKGTGSKPVTQGGLPSRIRKSTVSRKRDETAGEEEEKTVDAVTYEELDAAMEEVYDAIMKAVGNETSQNHVSADYALKVARKLEARLEASMDLGVRMKELEAAAASYADRINILDTGFSSQMSNYQEELTQMQHDLESGLENMAEALANTGGDATAVAELNMRFNDLQSSIDNSILRQKELREIQTDLSMDLDVLRSQLEVLRDTKADRDEVADALRDKAGLGALNGMVTFEQFDAVRGDIEKRIGAAYDKFNNQELVWQKVIDDLLRELNEKADILQVMNLRDNISQNLDNLSKKLDFMMNIVGEPTAAALARRIHRDTTCLSCSSPAHMDVEEPDTLPLLPALRTNAVSAEHTPHEDGDHGKCYPGFAIPHPREPNSHACNRWCGGSHTLLPKTLNRVPPGMIITCPERKLTQELGTDGRMYAVDTAVEKKPCTQCDIANTEQQNSQDKTRPDKMESLNGREGSHGKGVSITEDGLSVCGTFASIVMGSDMTPPLKFDEQS